MPRYDDRYETAKWRTAWLMLGFLVLVAVGIVTVLRPELEDEPTEDTPAETAEVETSDESGSDEPVQE
ncbi:MAG: hypothetical protein JRD92_02895 [Deltaproteobacteria bacterium]|nr:hypothetical protein [Deltaproteobacteria bacterium]MBW2159419.1 hypothetical protein [Deltaproteobacteria bacterium]MBW2376892.1 hypothetical protein [Deltaproteobacteria bacterium]MBW2585876.1 hypothetical protein [Deltaproteobacteria bacterium]